MADVSLIDVIVGDTPPVLDSAHAVAALEAVPYDQRVTVASTYEALQVSAQRCGDLPALHFLPNADPQEAGVVVTYRELMHRITQTANWLHDLGVGPGDVVSLMMPLVPEIYPLYFGAQAAGIVNPVNGMLSTEHTLHILQAARTKVLAVVGPMAGLDIYEKALAMRAHLPDLKAIIVVNGPDDPANQIYAFDQHIDRYRGDALDSGRVFQRDEAASYFHTGGTTGVPKLVHHSHRNEVYQAWVIGTMLNTGFGRHMLCGLPMFHVGGALTQGLGPLCCGTCLVILSPYGWRHPQVVARTWALIERFKPKVFGAIPTSLAAVIQTPNDGSDLSSVEVVSGGGSAVPVAVFEAYVQRLGVKALEVYGMTETSSVHTIGYRDWPQRIGSVGHAVPYSRVRVVKVDQAGQAVADCAVDEIGVVAMSGPGVTQGYLQAKHNQEAFVEPGWLNSGDLGRLDAQGYLWITGRAKDLIIRGGHNIDPQAIEETFFQHPGVALVAVVGQPDTYAGELPVAYVQKVVGHPVSAEELLAFVRERTPERAAVPVRLDFIDAIPLTAVGKVFKPQLRWHAAQRVGAELLADLAGEACAIEVKVAAHGTHGALMTVEVQAHPAVDEAAMREHIARRLSPLAWAHEVVWQHAVQEP